MPGGLGVDGVAHRKGEKVPTSMPYTRRQMRKRPRGEIWRAAKARDRWALSRRPRAGQSGRRHRAHPGRAFKPLTAHHCSRCRARKVLLLKKQVVFQTWREFFHTWSLTFDACGPPRVSLTIETVPATIRISSESSLRVERA